MNQPRERNRGARPEVLDVLALIPADGWIVEADLLVAALANGITAATPSGIRGLRSLRRAGAVTLRVDDADVVRLARTPKGTIILEAHLAARRGDTA